MTNKKYLRLWLTVFLVLFACFVVLQIPATWLISKFAPHQRILHNVNGNIWQGQADWRFQQLQGTIDWSVRPWELLRLRVASHVTVYSGQTKLTCIVAYGATGNLYLHQVNGKVNPETLAALINWQWPSTSINMQDVNITYKKQQGFKAADGQLSWSGGLLTYPMGQNQERIDVPPLLAQLNAEQEKLKILVKDSQKQRMADLVIGHDGMLDIQITQRFLLNAANYQGKAGLDTAVITTRQPLTSLRGN